VGIASIPLTTNQGFKNIICSSKLLNRFLFHILRGSIDELTAEGHGNTFLEIPAKVVRSFEIPLPPLQIQTAAADLLDALYRRLAGQKEELPTLPPPLAEQQRIVARIEELTAKIQEVKNLRQKATDETNALVGSCFERLLKEAPRQSRWEFGPIPAFAEVNPSRKGKIGLAPSELVSFVPMTAVDDVTGTIARPEMRTFAEVAKGYTWFLDGDVIFARITPCMQNGKAALAKNLMNAVGFGSTEFHVIRPSSKVTGEWLHALVRHKSFRDDAAAHFKGTAGQQRVPQSFLEQRVIPVPPISEQRRIVVYLDDLQAKVDALKKLQTETAAELDAMLPSILDKAFKGEL
jgi:type I restriction enzyme S subunit